MVYFGMTSARAGSTDENKRKPWSTPTVIVSALRSEIQKHSQSNDREGPTETIGPS
jgi:hypothetical protein